MAKTYVYIALFLSIIFVSDLAYSDQFVNPIGNDWITIDSSRIYNRFEDDSGRAQCLDINCYDSLHCVALINDGMHGFNWSVTKKTTDGGATWSIILLDTAQMIFPPRMKIFFHKEDIIVIGCDSGYVVRSTDGGATWETKKPLNIPPKNARLWQMFMKENIAIMQYEALGDDYISFDYGVTWKKVENFGAKFLFGAADYYSIIDSTTIFASGLVEEQTSATETKRYTYYFLTTDKGNTWKQINKIPRKETQYWRHLFANKYRGYSINLDFHERNSLDVWDTTTTTIYRTNDGGRSWHKAFEETRLGEGYLHYNILGENTIFAASYGDCILSTDGGDHWEMIPKPEFSDIYESEYITCFAMLTPKSWIVGRGPKLLKYVGKEVSVRELRLEGEAIPISPNPARDFISLSGLATAPGDRIEIYSQLGIKVLEATQGEESIDISRLPAGIYFVKSGGRAGKFVKING